MYFNSGKGFVFFLLSASFNFAFAQEQQITPNAPDITASLSTQPTKCITLTQGRQCFATVTFSWEASKKGNYCIYQNGKKEALDCWFNEKSNIMIFEFESSKTVQYQLVAYDFDNVVAQTTVEVSWVHKASPRKRRWRLF